MSPKKHRVVIIGGGFGGLNAATRLDHPHLDVTIIDEKNHHLFQPLLYQVATGGLSPADISAPLREVVKRQQNTRVILGKATDILPEKQIVVVDEKIIPYDSLVIASGVQHHYFGNTEWEQHAPGLKSLEEATYIRSTILKAFERAELTESEQERQKLLTFIVVGGGPTGVEMAGAIGELAYQTLKNNFRNFEPAQTKVLLLEALPRILPTFQESTSKAAAKHLQKMGVEVHTNIMVVDVKADQVTTQKNDTETSYSAATIFWAAGVRASFLGKLLHERFGAETDKSGRVYVTTYCQLPENDSIHVIGDLAIFKDKHGDELPGQAPVAIQQGKYVAQSLKRRAEGKAIKPFNYVHKGSMAVIGRGFAVSEVGKIRCSGFLAWLLWLFVHLMYLVGFEKRVLVFFQWAWNYTTKNRGARIITD